MEREDGYIWWWSRLLLDAWRRRKLWFGFCIIYEVTGMSIYGERES